MITVVDDLMRGMDLLHNCRDTSACPAWLFDSRIPKQNIVMALVTQCGQGSTKRVAVVSSLPRHFY